MIFNSLAIYSDEIPFVLEKIKKIPYKRIFNASSYSNSDHSTFIAYIAIQPFHIKKRIVDIYQYHNSIFGILHIKHHPLCSYYTLIIDIIYISIYKLREAYGYSNSFIYFLLFDSNQINTFRY